MTTSTANILESETARSCRFTMDATAKADHPKSHLQKIPETPYTIPSREQRLLRIRLLMEEFQETAKAMGFATSCIIIDAEETTPENVDELDIYDMIDGLCDLIYVAVGGMTAMNVPDMPHMNEVCDRNNAKFPKGVARVHPETGKYLKPEGWTGPDHPAVERKVMGVLQSLVNARHTFDSVVDKLTELYKDTDDSSNREFGEGV